MRVRFLAIATATMAVFFAGVAAASNPFVDVGANQHASNIDAIYNAGITTGCDSTHYCPADAVKRDQMATFLARAAGLSAGTAKNFPVANARGPQQAFCAVKAANPQSFNGGTCATTLASLGLMGGGERSSVAIGADGLPVVAYSAGAGGLRLAMCQNVACTAATTRTLDATSLAGLYNAVAIGNDGLPVVASYASTDLFVHHCEVPSCATFTTFRVDSYDDVGQYVDMAIGPDGPVLSYYDTTTDDLKILKCRLNDCSVQGYWPVDGAGDVGRYTSVAVDGDAIVVSYWDVTNGDLKVARCTDYSCDEPVTNKESVDTTGYVGAFSSITVGIDHNPIVSYETEGDLKVVQCNDPQCDTGGEVFTIVEKAVGDQITGMDTSIAIGTDGLPTISYRKERASDFAVRLVHCRSRSCATFDPPVDIDDMNGFFSTTTSLAIGIDGVPVVAYARSYDPSNMEQLLARKPA
jgi:hypothetical protein